MSCGFARFARCRKFDTADLSPRVWRRSPRIDFYRDRTAASPIGARPGVARRIIYFLPGIGRPEIYLSTVSLLAQGARPKYSFVPRERGRGRETRPVLLHGSCLVSRCSSASTPANLPTPIQVLGDFECPVVFVALYVSDDAVLLSKVPIPFQLA